MPNPSAADLAATVWGALVTDPGPHDEKRAADALDALVARCEQAEGERDEWKERLELTLDSCPACGGSGQVEVPERNMCATCDGSGVVSAAWMYERIEQLERERDSLQACLNHEETYADGMLPKLRERAEEAERERDALQQEKALNRPGYARWSMVGAEVIARAEAAERRVAELEEIKDKFDHLSSEYSFDRPRGDHLVYESEWQAFDAWQRKGKPE